MSPDRNDRLPLKLTDTDLEPYRRLVELQKQMIELAQQHEQSRRKRDALHQQIVRDGAGFRRNGATLRSQMQQSAGRLLKRVSGWTWKKPELTRPPQKEPLSC